jgi:hypothetical protein
LNWTWVNKPGLFLLSFCTFATSAAAEAPLSAIDWLSQSVATPTSLPRAPQQFGPLNTEPPVTGGVKSGTITVAPIGSTNLDSLGLVPASRAGLPRTLWGKTPSADLARLLRAERPDTLPAVQSLLHMILIAELDPPADSDPQGVLFLARVDKLLDLGALDPALSLLELLSAPQAEAFRRWFDISLLIGQEDRACEVMRKSPQIAPTFPARIFCLARGGDWEAAALSLRTGQTLGTIDPQTAALLGRFLDPDLFEGQPALPMPERPSPLVLRMMEAVGEPIPTGTLPVAFAQADLRSNTGWKARIEAGERLARTGAIPPNRLLGLYTEQKAAASGGVWERVKGVQAIESALAAGDKEKASAGLLALWPQIEENELEVPFANLFGARLAALGLKGDAGALAFRVGLLSDAYEKVAVAHKPQDSTEAFLIGVARGESGVGTPPDQMGVAIADAFQPDARPGEAFSQLLADDQLGAAVLKAIEKVTLGASGDLRDVTDGLVLLRTTGMEATARRASLELLLLERRG